MALIPKARNEGLALACISGLVGALNGKRLTHDEALAEIATQWDRWKVAPDRQVFVLSAELRHRLGDEYYDKQDRALLLAAGADLDLAARMKAEDPVRAWNQAR